MANGLQYHLAELSAARDGTHPAHCLPRIESRHRRILDVGCGMGQTLLALDCPAHVEAHGIDPDRDAIEAGQRVAPAHIHLQVGSGEQLPYPDAYFDLVICRVALPYMRVREALMQFGRVSVPGADIWLILHPAQLYTRRALQSLRGGKIKDAAYCGFVLLNGLLLSTTGAQLRFRNRTETHQTSFGMRTAMRRAGFDSIVLEKNPFFLAKGRKRT